MYINSKTINQNKPCCALQDRVSWTLVRTAAPATKDRKAWTALTTTVSARESVKSASTVRQVNASTDIRLLNEMLWCLPSDGSLMHVVILVVCFQFVRPLAALLIRALIRPRGVTALPTVQTATMSCDVSKVGVGLLRLVLVCLHERTEHSILCTSVWYYRFIHS